MGRRPLRRSRSVLVGMVVCALALAAGVRATASTSAVTVTVVVNGGGHISGGGINCPPTCRAAIASGARVTLRASAASGYRFAGWSGACTGLAACSLQPRAAVKVVATFSKLSTGTTTTASSSITGSGWNTDAASLRGKNGQRFRWNCPPDGPTNLSATWGTDIYDDNSLVCIAAVHAGVITLASGGVVVIEIRPGQSSYTGSTRNGITTYSYGPTAGSFVVVGKG